VTECQAGVPLSHVGFVHYGAKGWPPSISHLTRIDSILLVVFFLKSARVLHSFRNSCICCPLPVVAIASSKGLRKRMRCHDGRSESCEVSDWAPLERRSAPPVRNDFLMVTKRPVCAKGHLPKPRGSTKGGSLPSSTVTQDPSWQGARCRCSLSA